MSMSERSYRPLRHLLRSLGSPRPRVLERPVLRVFRFDEPLSDSNVHIRCRAINKFYLVTLKRQRGDLTENDLDPIVPRHIAYTHCNTVKIIIKLKYKVEIMYVDAGEIKNALIRTPAKGPIRDRHNVR